MQLVSVLASGVSGALSGRAELYRRGTSSRADWYEDFEGTSKISSGANIALSANGTAQVYVNEYVEVFVYDSGGTLVIQFTVGNSSPAVEYIGPAFTGAAYGGGAAAVSRPVTLQAVLDLWKVTNGAADWKVDAGNGAVSIPAVLGPAVSIWFNVQSSTYNATGDGVADDTAEIQAAIDACTGAGGGVVYFPPGTYRLTSALDVETGVQLLGCGPQSTALVMDSASEATANFKANSRPCTVDGLHFSNQQDNTGAEMVDIELSCEVIFRNCRFGGTSYAQHSTMIDQNGVAVFLDCSFSPGSTGGSTVLDIDGSTRMERCAVGAGATSNPVVSVAAETTMADCTIAAGASSTTVLSITNAAAGTTLERCAISAGSGTTNTVTSAARSTLRGCTVAHGAASATCVDTSGLTGTARCLLDGCVISPSTACSSTNGLVYGRAVDIRNTRFENGQSTSGTYSCFKTSSTTLAASIVGCTFVASDGATVTCMELGSYTAASVFSESANTFGDTANDTAYNYTIPATASVEEVTLGSRGARVFYNSGDDSAAVAVPSDQYGVMVYRKTGTTAATFTLADAPSGASFRAIIWCVPTTGTTGNIGIANAVAVSAASAIQDDRSNIYDFASVQDTIGNWWCTSERLDIPS